MSTNHDSKAWKPKDSTASSYDVTVFKEQRGKLGLELPMKSNTFSSLVSLDRLYIYIYIYACVLSRFSRVCLFLTLWTEPATLLCPWGSPGKNTGVGCHALLQGIFLTQGLNCVSCSSCIAGGFFTIGPPGKPIYIHIYIHKSFIIRLRALHLQFLTNLSYFMAALIGGKCWTSQRKCSEGGFPGGSVVKNPPANAADTHLIPFPGGSHMPWSKRPCTTIIEPVL